MAIARLSAADVGAIGSACLESRDELRERFFLSACGPIRVTVRVTVRVSVNSYLGSAGGHSEAERC